MEITAVKKGLYLVFWPNKTYSVIYYKKSVSIVDLFWDVDCFGDPHCAKILRIDGDVAIDFEAEKHGKRLGVSKNFNDIPKTKWIRFPAGISAMAIESLCPAGVCAS